MGADKGWVTNEKLSDSEIEEMYNSYVDAGENPFQGAFGHQVHDWASSYKGLAAGINANSNQLDMAAGVAEVTANIAVLGAGAASEGEGLLSKAISKTFGNNTAGAGRVFWSGGKEAMAAAADYAASTGG